VFHKSNLLAGRQGFFLQPNELKTIIFIALRKNKQPFLLLLVFEKVNDFVGACHDYFGVVPSQVSRRSPTNE
jgi:hypothetical protein